MESVSEGLEKSIKSRVQGYRGIGGKTIRKKVKEILVKLISQIHREVI